MPEGLELAALVATPEADDAHKAKGEAKGDDGQQRQGVGARGRTIARASERCNRRLRCGAGAVALGRGGAPQRSCGADRDIYVPAWPGGRRRRLDRVDRAFRSRAGRGFVDGRRYRRFRRRNRRFRFVGHTWIGGGRGRLATRPGFTRNRAAAHRASVLQWRAATRRPLFDTLRRPFRRGRRSGLRWATRGFGGRLAGRFSRRRARRHDDEQSRCCSDRRNRQITAALQFAHLLARSVVVKCMDEYSKVGLKSVEKKTLRARKA